MELTRLTRQRATDEVYQALRQSILGHLFIPGERLQVEEIATKLGVSLTPVRHAIQQLATEGLIEIRPRSGTFVAKLTTRDLEETSDIRCALECLAAETAVRLATGHQISQLRSLAARIGTPVHSAEDRKRHEARALFLTAAYVEVGVVGAAIREPVDQPRIAVEGEDNRLVSCKDGVEFYADVSVLGCRVIRSTTFTTRIFRQGMCFRSQSGSAPSSLLAHSQMPIPAAQCRTASSISSHWRDGCFPATMTLT
jgi:DNA-binding transcriptional regulator YhcF (GntR family)